MIVFPAASVAVQITLVVPAGKNVPDDGVQETVTPGVLLLTVGGGKLTIAPFLPGSLNTWISAGQMMVGGAPSMTVTLNEQVLVFPAASVAVQVTVVVPTGKNEPDAGVQEDVRPGQLSVTVGSGKLTFVPLEPGSTKTVMLAGQVI